MKRPIFTINGIRVCAYKIDSHNYKVSENSRTRIKNNNIISGPCELASEELLRERQNKPRPQKLSHYLYVSEHKALIRSLKMNGEPSEVELRSHCKKTDEELRAEIKLRKKLASEAYYLRRKNVARRKMMRDAIISSKPKINLLDYKSWSRFN